VWFECLVKIFKAEQEQEQEKTSTAESPKSRARDNLKSQNFRKPH